jgi:hypothetical protein
MVKNTRYNLVTILIIYAVLITACNKLSDSSSQNTSSNVNQSSETLQTNIDPNTGCLLKPETLLEIEEIDLQGKTVTKSGQLTAGKYIGYQFEGKKGQKLSYRTPNNLCLYVFQPNTDILEGVELPIDGKYIIQITLPQGASTFDLEMSLNDSFSASIRNQDNQNTPYQNNSNNQDRNNDYNSGLVHSITEEEAINLVKEWYQAKREIFGQEYNQDLLTELATGKLSDKIVKPDGSGSLDWLRQNSCYYTYDYSYIDNIISFSNTGARPTLTVQVSEKLTLNPTYDTPSSAGCSAIAKSYTKNVTYWFEKENGFWKIYDYELY